VPGELRPQRQTLHRLPHDKVHVQRSLQSVSSQISQHPPFSSLEQNHLQQIRQTTTSPPRPLQLSKAHRASTPSSQTSTMQPTPIAHRLPLLHLPFRPQHGQYELIVIEKIWHLQGVGKILRLGIDPIVCLHCCRATHTSYPLQDPCHLFRTTSSPNPVPTPHSMPADSRFVISQTRPITLHKTFS
jgi:hypothetical protein